MRPEEETVAWTQSLFGEALGDTEGKRGWVLAVGRWEMGEGRAGRTEGVGPALLSHNTAA